MALWQKESRKLVRTWNETVGGAVEAAAVVRGIAGHAGAVAGSTGHAMVFAGRAVPCALGGVGHVVKNGLGRVTKAISSLCAPPAAASPGHGGGKDQQQAEGKPGDLSNPQSLLTSPSPALRAVVAGGAAAVAAFAVAFRGSPARSAPELSFEEEIQNLKRARSQVRWN